MLIQKPPSVNEVVTIKLVSGDEVVGRFISQDAQGVTINQPVIVTVQPSRGSLALGFMPFAVSADDTANVTLPSISMLTRPMPTRADVANNYRSATGGISMPPSGLVLPT